MALADFTAFRAKCANPLIRTEMFYQDSYIATSQNGWIHAPLMTPITTAASLDNTSAWNLWPSLRSPDTGNKLYIGEIAYAIPGAQFGNTFVIVDRLSHQGGLSGTVTSEQTTNLPTAALPRYTSGAGVFPWIHIYTAIGSTGTTLALNYTNQSGTSGRTSPPTTIGGAGYSEAHKCIPIPLADGDTGCRSVEGVTLLASTGTAGAFGVCLMKPLLVVPSNAIGNNIILDAVLGLGCSFEEILSTACITMLRKVGGSYVLYPGPAAIIEA